MNTKAPSHSMHTYAKYCTLNYARKGAFNPPTRYTEDGSFKF